MKGTVPLREGSAAYNDLHLIAAGVTIKNEIY